MGNRLFSLMLMTLFFSFIMYSAYCCPAGCLCNFNHEGRKVTRCNAGRMTHGIPVGSIDKDVNIIEISAPALNPNKIIIGPIFQNFKFIEEVHIIQSNIPAIGKHTFWDVPSLKVLNLSKNNIESIVESNFKGLINLAQLNLDENRIQSMHSGVFVHLPELEVLTLSKNQITQLSPRVFLKLDKLTHLDLSYNPLSEVEPDAFKDVQTLKQFRCRQCGIKNINSQLFSTLLELEFLDFGENEITDLDPDALIDLTYIQVLYLDGNKLSVILDNTFRYNRYLRFLNLSRNYINKMMDMALNNLTNLMTFDISYNKLESLNPTLVNAISYSLQNLKLGGNYIPVVNLKQFLYYLPNLKMLSLYDMHYPEMPPEIFFYNVELQLLNLSHTGISRFSPYILSPLKNLRELDISRNKLRGLDDKTCHKFETIKNVIYHGNPWLCDLCHITPLIKRLNKTYHFRDIVCFGPENLKGRPLKSVSFEMLDWCEGSELAIKETNLILLSSRSQIGVLSALASIIVLLLLTTIAIYIINSKYRAYYYTNEDKRAQDKESVFENRIAGNFLNKRYESRRVTIATIDELNKDSNLQINLYN